MIIQKILSENFFNELFASYPSDDKSDCLQSLGSFSADFGNETVNWR